jgi:2-polyprenyl-6-methoxyphenol hydroxylase-like FAD-dependent oxidoreductase
MQHTNVLIIGAGPTGLALALWLAKLAVKVRIIDKTAVRTTSRALAVQARTLELYRQLDLAEAVVARGHKVPAISIWVRGKRADRISFETVGKELTAYPYLDIFPQDEHERLLIDRLPALGLSVERQTELIDFSDRGDGIVARLRGPDGAEDCETSYLAGCDGARSLVREKLGVGFPGGTYDQMFYVADIEGAGPAVNGDLNVCLDEADFLAVFPLAGQGRARLIGTVRQSSLANSDELKFEDVSSRAIEHMKVEVRKVNWFSTYHVHHRVANHFRKGRAFLLGDAAHIHSPAGGQGMNTGIGDAINLAWKLAAVRTGGAQDDLLDTYEAERIGFARRLVATTDRVFSFATAEGPLADFVRTRIAPLMIPRILSFAAVREYLFRTAAQITLNYRISPLSAGSAGHVRGGDRLPWVPINGKDNHAPLSAMRWQIHVYGAANEELVAWCSRRDVPLHVFSWDAAYRKAGLECNALYLIRPDTYVALAERAGDPKAIERYCAERHIRLEVLQSN